MEAGLKELFDEGYLMAETCRSFFIKTNWTREEYEAYKEGFVSFFEEENKKGKTNDKEA